MDLVDKNFVAITLNEKKLLSILKIKDEECKNLSSKIDDLVSRLSKLEAKSSETEIVSDTESYHTEDDQLSFDVEWIRRISKKEKRKEKASNKRKADESLSPRDERSHVPVKPSTSKITEEVIKSKLPPPIMVDEVENIEQIRKLMDLPKTSYRIKILNNKKIKINVDNADDYKTATKALSLNNKSWFSFENKHERPYRVMVKKLHHSSSCENIKDDLKEQGFKILDAVNKIGWHSKQKLDMFVLSFDASEDIDKIKNIKVILNQVVEVVALRKNKLLVQCKKCQSFGHSQNYCEKEPRCVKCVGKHLTKDCNKPNEDPAKCVLCGKAHPANYRGCMVAKELQKIKNKSHVETGKSYAQAVKKSQKETRAQPKPNTVAQTLEIILSKLNSFDERLKKIENSTKGAFPKTKN